MKRLIAFALILSLLLLLPACAAANVNSTEGKDNVDRSKVWNEVTAALGYEPYRLQYCASENGYHIVRWGGNTADMQTVMIAGYTFNTTSDTRLMAYKDGEFTDLVKAFFLGLVSRDGIARAHEASEGKKTDAAPKVYDSAQAFFEDKMGPLEEFRIFGEENGCQIAYVAWKDGKGQPSTKTIADIEFRFAENSFIYIYRDGTFCGLNWAYYQEVVSKELVTQVAQLYAEYQPKE
jgi:hypothetical protein